MQKFVIHLLSIVFLLGLSLGDSQAQTRDCAARFGARFLTPPGGGTTFPVRFENRSFPAPSRTTPVAYRWDFGDGRSSSSQNPTNIYSAPGRYRVTLTIRTRTCTSSVDTTIVIERPVVERCEARFTFNVLEPIASSGRRLFPVQFTNLSVPRPSSTVSVRYSWDFGDGSTSSEENPTKRFTRPGTYRVKLVVRTPAGVCEVTQEVTVGIAPPRCSALFRAEEIKTDNPRVWAWRFINMSEPRSDSGAGRRVTYEWDFGNGVTSNDISPTARYERPGTFTVRLRLIIDGRPACDSMITIVNREREFCETGFTFTVIRDSISSTGGTRVQFTSTVAPIRPGVRATYSWDFGDGNTATVANPSNLYLRPGRYIVKLRVTIGQAVCESQQTIEIRDNNTDRCRANFEFEILPSLPAIPGFQVRFNNKSTPAGVRMTYAWDFGDGNTSTDANPLHRYAKPGEYRVRLVITTADGCRSEAVIPVILRGDDNRCDANFSWEVLPHTPVVGAPIPVKFTNLSKPSPGTPGVTYVWLVNRERRSDAPNPTIEFRRPDLYLVTLQILINGRVACEKSDSVMLGNPQAGACNADFRFERVASEDPTVIGIRFTNTSNWDTLIGIRPVFAWDFGDGTSSSEYSPIKRYVRPGTYKVTLTITVGRCTHTVTKEVVVEGNNTGDCRAAFQAQPLPPIDSTASAMAIRFFNASTPRPGGSVMVRYLWDFGDSTTSTDFEPVKQYRSPGVYSVRLTVIAGRCTNVFSQRIQVPPVRRAGAGRFAAQASDISAFNLYPNPNNGQFNLQVAADGSFPVVVRVVNMAGQEVYRQTWQVQAGLNSYAISNATIPAGIYAVSIDGPATQQHAKMIVE
jgi:PKD repeat protein